MQPQTKISVELTGNDLHRLTYAATICRDQMQADGDTEGAEHRDDLATRLILAQAPLETNMEAQNG